MKPLPTTATTLSLLAFLTLQASCLACGDGQTTIVPLPTLGGTLVRLNAMSAGGHLTGYANTATNTTHAFLFAGGTMLDLSSSDTAFSQGIAVNSAGQVAGDFAAGVFETHAFIYDNGSVTDLGTLGGPFSLAIGINEAGQVTGNSLLPDYFSFAAFVYENGSLTDIGTLGGSSSFANAINQAGHVVGASAIAFDFESHAFLYTNGVMLDLGTLGGFYSTAYAVNDLDVVVGESELANFETHAFLFTEGVMLDLGTLGGTYSSASAVNLSGQVIGVATTANDDETHGFIHSAGVMTDLGTLGGLFSEPLALDNLGRVVGVSDLTNASQRPFLWQNGVMVDLNTLLPANSGWELLTADFINDSGRIAGHGLLNGVERAFVMDLGSGNNPPVAVAGNDQNVACSAQAVLDASLSSDPDGDALTYEWSENGAVLGTALSLAVSFSAGTHTVLLKVTDPCGLSSEDTVSVIVTDTSAPVISGSPTTLTVAASADCQSVVPDVAASVTASDNCTAMNQLAKTQNPGAGTVLPSGPHEITVTVADTAGNSATTNVTLVIADVTAPNITSITASPSVLSPPNKQNVPVTVSVLASDTCDPSPVSRITSVTCNEPPAPDDIQITGDLTVNLVAAKNSSGTTRVYTITVECTDASGNTSTGMVTVSVPKNNGNGGGKKP